MADDGDDYGGFVFDEAASEADGTDATGGTSETDGVGGLPSGVVAGLVVVVAVVVLVGFAIAYPAATGSLFGDGAGDSGSPPANDTTSIGTTNTAGASGSTATATGGSVYVTGTVTSTRQSATTSSGTRATTASSSATATPTPTPTATATPAPTQTTTSPRTTTTTTPATGEDRTPTGSRSPVVDAFTVTDRSSGNAAVFAVAWNVSDANRDLMEVTVSLVADPDGAARTVSQRNFDAGGAQSAGSTTFEVMGGGGETYEIRIEATDGRGNSVFELTRAVADGESDG